MKYSASETKYWNNKLTCKISYCHKRQQLWLKPYKFSINFKWVTLKKQKYNGKCHLEILWDRFKTQG